MQGKSSLPRVIGSERQATFGIIDAGLDFLLPQVAMEIAMLKYIILGVASLAFVGTAFAADLPRPQPVAQTGPVGKYPVGKVPIGKAPLGKAPVVAAKY
jgi:hypothetical protein